MSPVMAEIEKHDFILCLLNQVIYSTDKYGNRKMDAGGGIALKHDVHFSTRIEEVNDTWDNNYLVARTSKISIDKSKLGPEVYNIPMVLDITNGGVIDEVKSFVEYLMWVDDIHNASGWYKFDNIINKQASYNPVLSILNDYNKSYRYQDIVDTVANNRVLYLALQYSLMLTISRMYKLQSKVIKPYLDMVASELSSLKYIAEFSATYNEDLKDTYEQNPKILESIKLHINNQDNADDKLICLQCGELSSNASYCSDCGIQSVVSIKKAKEIFSEVLDICSDINPIDSSDQEVESIEESK